MSDADYIHAEVMGRFYDKKVLLTGLNLSKNKLIKEIESLQNDLDFLLQKFEQLYRLKP